MEYETHFLNLKQVAEAELPLKKQEYADAKTALIGVEDELANIDRALEEARVRRRRIVGSRQGYIAQKAADIAQTLLGGEPPSKKNTLQAEDAHGLQEAEIILQQRRGEIVQAKVIVNSKLRMASQDFYNCKMKIAAAEFELSRHDFFNKWCKVTALCELSQSGPISDSDKWEKIHIPSVTLSKSLRCNSTIGEYSPLTTACAMSLIHDHKSDARFEIED